VITVEFEASLSDAELQDAHTHISDAALLNALDARVGLGEWLIAGPELMKRLNGSRGLNKAFAEMVIAWYRTGLDQPLAEEDARRLWVGALPSGLRLELLRRQLSDQVKLFENASAWACDPITRPCSVRTGSGHEVGRWIRRSRLRR
jgi:hypothetical protein